MFQSKDEIITTLRIYVATIFEETPSEFADFESKINGLYIVMWNEGSIKDFYLVMIREKNDQGHLLHFAHCVISDPTKRQWQYPSTSDSHVAILGKVIQCDIIVSWIMKRRNSKFEIDHWQIIDGLFKELYVN